MMISQNNMPGTRTHRVLGLGPHPLQRRLQSTGIAASQERTVNLGHIRIELLFQLLKLRITHKRAIQHQNFGLAAVLIQHIFQVPKPRVFRLITRCSRRLSIGGLVT